MFLMMKKLLVLSVFLCFSTSFFGQAAAGDYDLLLAQKRLNVLIQTKFGRINGLLPFSNVGLDILYSLGLKVSLRAEAAIGKGNLLEFGGMYSYKNEIVNQAHLIYQYHPHTQQGDYEKENEEITAYINKHKMRSIRLGVYGMAVAATVFDVDDLGYGNSTMSLGATSGRIIDVKGLPEFRYQSTGIYAGWSIYNSVNYTNAEHKSNFATFGRHNDYFCINLDALVGVSTLALTSTSKTNNYRLQDLTLDYTGIPVGGRAQFEIGVKNVKQRFSFDANFELARYPYHKAMSFIVGVGVRVSLFDNIISNEGERKF